MLPVAVMGPVMGNDVSGSNHVVHRILDGGMPGYPNLWMPIVDVRDVASAHILAMTAPGAAGQRFLVSSGPSIAMKEIGALLRADLGDAAGVQVVCPGVVAFHERPRTTRIGRPSTWVPHGHVKQSASRTR
jgi:nucleoside-diphosphate-sugar epimerase